MRFNSDEHRILNDETAPAEIKDAIIRRGMEEIKAGWTEARERAARGNPNEDVEITQIRMSDLVQRRPGRTEY